MFMFMYLPATTRIVRAVYLLLPTTSCYFLLLPTQVQPLLKYNHDLLPTTTSYYLLPTSSPRQYTMPTRRDQHREGLLAEHLKHLVRVRVRVLN